MELNLNIPVREARQSYDNAIDYQTLFTGECNAEPIMFNPTPEQLQAFRKTKKLPETKYSLELNKKDFKGNEVRLAYQKVSLLCAFSPMENLQPEFKKENPLASFGEKRYVNFDFVISDRLVFSTASPKVLVIDAKLHSDWVPCDREQMQKLYNNYRLAKAKKEDVTKSFNAFQEYTKTCVMQKQSVDFAERGDINYMSPPLDLQTVRPAREGEEVMMKLFFDMSTIYNPRYKTQKQRIEAKVAAEKEKVAPGAENSYQQWENEYKKFSMGFVFQIFDLFLEKRYDDINGIFTNEKYESVFKIFNKETKEMIRKKLGIFLGVSRYTDKEGNERFSQVCYDTIKSFGANFTFTAPWANKKPQLFPDLLSEYGRTNMPKDMCKEITNRDYGFSKIANFQNSFEFKPFYLQNVVEPTANEEIDARPSNTHGTSFDSIGSDFDIDKKPASVTSANFDAFSDFPF